LYNKILIFMIPNKYHYIFFIKYIFIVYIFGAIIFIVISIILIKHNNSLTL